LSIKPKLVVSFILFSSLLPVLPSLLYNAKSQHVVSSYTLILNSVSLHISFIGPHRILCEFTWNSLPDYLRIVCSPLWDITFLAVFVY
jgi:hypothetical protein